MTGKLAVVTGASGGIGLEIARTLISDGFFVVAQYRSNPQKLAALADGAGEKCEVVHADLASTDGITTLVEAVRHRAATTGMKVAAVVNNAGKLLGPSFADATPEAFDEYVAINTKAPFFLTQMLSQDMPTGASVVNISSASAHIASAGDIVYAMTKTALESLTRHMAEALASRGIRVNAVIPGFTDNGHPAFVDDRALAYMSSLSALGGVAAPSAVADAVSFLVSKKSCRTTGSTLDVTGGMTLHPRPHREGSVRDLL